MYRAELKENGDIQLYPSYARVDGIVLFRCVSLRAKNIIDAEKEAVYLLRRPTTLAVDAATRVADEGSVNQEGAV